MPHGLHIATCLHCGRQWTVGDCIPITCPNCVAAGHRGWPLTDCPPCLKESKAMRARIDAALAAARSDVLVTEDDGEPD